MVLASPAVRGCTSEVRNGDWRDSICGEKQKKMGNMVKGYRCIDPGGAGACSRGRQRPVRDPQNDASPGGARSARQTVSAASQLARRRPYRGSIGNVSMTGGWRPRLHDSAPSGQNRLRVAGRGQRVAPEWFRGPGIALLVSPSPAILGTAVCCEFRAPFAPSIPSGCLRAFPPQISDSE